VNKQTLANLLSQTSILVIFPLGGICYLL
jgi:hypothetical protein